MLVIGAGGFAKEILEILKQRNELDNLFFYDDVSQDIPETLYGEFQLIRRIEDVFKLFKCISNSFTIGIGNPFLRKKMADKFLSFGGELKSTISPLSVIGSFDVNLGVGCNILSGVVLSNSVVVGTGCIIYYNSLITHDCEINDYVEISPNVTLLGKCKIGSFTQIGASSTLLPGIKIGNNVIIGAGSVVTKDIPDNCLAYEATVAKSPFK
jgi:sugar O-acyltransferase (sialic acid O-acetyltransferase NeuD family)